jgi:hypothetical protein
MMETTETASSVSFLVCRRAHMSYLSYFWGVFTHSGIQHILYFVFRFVFLRLVCPVLPVSLDLYFWIVASVISIVYS